MKAFPARGCTANPRSFYVATPGAERLNFIKHAQQCGFSLAETRELLELRSDDRSCCDDAYPVAVEKKLQLEHKIRALQAMSRALSGLIEICSHDRKSIDECPILGALEAGIAEQSSVTSTRALRKKPIQ